MDAIDTTTTATNNDITTSLNNTTITITNTTNNINIEATINTTTTDSDSSSFQWTAATAIQAVAIFILAGFAEILGGWMVWMAIRGNTKSTKPWWYAVIGSLTLVLYGFIPTLQPTDSFGRVYAVYGGFFIVLSFLIGWWLDGDRPDTGDVIGGMIALVGVLVILFWPR
jgi:small multidrug resistance family-3 protein